MRRGHVTFVARVVALDEIDGKRARVVADADEVGLQKQRIILPRDRENLVVDEHVEAAAHRRRRAIQIGRIELVNQCAEQT